MSFNNKKIIEVKSPLKLPAAKNLNYFSVLNTENTSLNNEIIKGNELISKLRKKIFNNEQEKKELLLISSSKDKEIKEIKKKLEETKEKIGKIKEKIKKFKENDIKDNNNPENINLNNSIQNTIINLQNKITDLELELQNKKINKKFISLEKKRSISMIYKRNNNSNSINNIITKNNNNGIINDDLFLTGRNEAREYQENNLILECKLNKLKINLNNIEIEKNNLIKLLEQYTSEKKKMLILLNEKNEKINEKLNEGSKISNNIIKQIIENKKYNDLLFQIKIKKQNLEKDILDLENIILKQKTKINELSTSVGNIIKIIENRNNEIKSNKKYILNLENDIKELNKKFINIRQNKYSYNKIKIIQKNDDLPKLLEQIEELKKEYIYLIEKNKKSPKLADNIKINYNIINNSGNNAINIIKNKQYKNISIIPNERYENKIIKLINHNKNYHSRNYFNEINNIYNQKNFISKTKIKKINNISADILNKKILNNYNDKKNIIKNYNKISPNSKDYKNQLKNNSMRNINIKKYRNNISSKRSLKKINMEKNKKRIYSTINNRVNNIQKKKNMKSFSGIEYNNNFSEYDKINEFKDFLNKIINDFEK